MQNNSDTMALRRLAAVCDLHFLVFIKFKTLEEME